MKLTLRVRNSEKKFVFNVEQLGELTIGRVNPYTGKVPDIDLETINGKDKGVSRSHAVILRQGHSVCIVDLGSDNGTFINGQRLSPNQPGEIQDDDEIRLGRLILRVTLA